MVHFSGPNDTEEQERAMANGYDDVRAEDEIERGRRVIRAESDENDLHPVARRAVVGTHANVAVERANRRSR